MKHWISGWMILLTLPVIAASAGINRPEQGRPCLTIMVTGFETTRGLVMVSLVNSREVFENNEAYGKGAMIHD